MTAIAAICAALALVLLAWSYVVYPELLRRLARPAPSESPASGSRPSVEVLVSAADEEKVIAARVHNLLSSDYAGPYAVSIGCDGCRDSTAALALEAGDGRVRVREFPERRGKAAVLNDLVSLSRSEVVIFTDANSAFEPGAVRSLVERFADPAVGAVCGRLVLRAASLTAAAAETEFWDREMKLKEAEGSLGVCLGGNGAIYAARRELIGRLPPDSPMDDFLIPASIARQGRKVVFAGDAIASEDLTSGVREEIERRFRIGIGAGQVLRRETWLFGFRRHPLLSLAFVSRKAARWIAPVLAIAAAFAAMGSPALRPFGAALIVLACVFVLLALARVQFAGIFGRLYYFSVINLALAAGVVLGLLGRRRAIWKPTVR